MRRLSASDIVLKALGLLLLTAAVLKGHELLTVPVANKDLWSWRPFLIFQVEFELALGIWLLSGVLKRSAWFVALLCFSLFCAVTLYKGLTGAASCGCFGRVHVNPWITLSTIDLPAVVALGIFRPVCPLAPVVALLWRQRSKPGIVGNSLKPLLTLPRFMATVGFIVAVLSTTTPILAFCTPAAATPSYEILEPETWVGKELPILKYIDIGERLRTGTWLLLFYHNGCPDCQRAILHYEQMAHDMTGTEDLFPIALIEVPPYNVNPIAPNSLCARGWLANAKEWLVATPTSVLIHNGVVTVTWQGEVPDFKSIMVQFMKRSETTTRCPERLYTCPEYSIYRHERR